MDSVENARALSAGIGLATARRTEATSNRAGGVQGATMPAEAAREFEAFLLHRMLKSATRPIGGRHLLDGGPGGRLFRDMFLEETARLAVERRGLGLFRAIGGSSVSDGSEAIVDVDGGAASGEEPR